MSTSSLLASLAKPLIYFGTLVGLSFLFTTREMLKLQEEYHEAKAGDLAQKLQHESRMFRAQRVSDRHSNLSLALGSSADPVFAPCGSVRTST